MKNFVFKSSAQSPSDRNLPNQHSELTPATAVINPVVLAHAPHDASIEGRPLTVKKSGLPPAFSFVMAVIGVIVMGMVSIPAMADEYSYDNPDQTVPADKSDSKPLSVTPSVNLLNFPHPAEGALELVFSKTFSLKYSKSFKPTFTVDGNKVELDNQSFGLRGYPNQGPFFIGLAYGKHSANGNRHETINGFDTDIYADVSSEYLTPSVGWKWVYNSGFTIGVEFGWIFPFNGRANVSSNQDLNPLVAGSDEYQNARNDVEKGARDFADRGLPSIGLLEVGWTF